MARPTGCGTVGRPRRGCRARREVLTILPATYQNSLRAANSNPANGDAVSEQAVFEAGERGGDVCPDIRPEGGEVGLRHWLIPNRRRQRRGPSKRPLRPGLRRSRRRDGADAGEHSTVGGSRRPDRTAAMRRPGERRGRCVSCGIPLRRDAGAEAGPCAFARSAGRPARPPPAASDEEVGPPARKFCNFRRKSGKIGAILEKTVPESG